LSPAERADRLAAGHDWHKRLYRTRHFDLTGYAPAAAGSDRLVVYLEGDGRAWLSRTRLSPDPTPIQPYTLELAVKHARRGVLYLARPCQYVVRRPSRGCHPRYWSSHRYASEVVAAMGQAIDQAKRARRARRLVLIGYSGGGVIAALLAARRTDVDELVTIAANLDSALWTRLDDLTPLVGSLDPVDFVDELQTVRQRHYVGTDDDVVPASVVRSYIRRLPDRSRTRLIVLEGFDHDCCWIENWPALLER